MVVVRPASAPGVRRSINGNAKGGASSFNNLAATGGGGSSAAGSSAGGPRSGIARESKVLSGRERLTDVETLEDLYFNSRKELQKLDNACEILKQEVGELEEAEYRKDRLLLDILLTSKTTPSWEPELSKLRADLETLAEAKKKTCELRELVEERDVAIASITKQLKQSRAAQLEQEVAKMQALVKATKIQHEQFCDEAHLARTRQLHTQIHRVWQETHQLQSGLTSLFQKQNRIQETMDLKQMQMRENEKQTEVLEKKMAEIEEKEKLAERRLEEQLSNVEERIVEMEERAKENLEQLQQKRHREQLETKKLEHPVLQDRDNFYVSSRALGPLSGGGSGSSASSSSGSKASSGSAFRNAPPELKSVLLAMKHLPSEKGLLAAAAGPVCTEAALTKVLERCVPLKQMSVERFVSLLRKYAPFAFTDEGELRTLDFEIALHSFQEDVVKPEAIREACKLLRRKCIEKRVSEKTCKEIFFRSASTAIGSFLLKLDLEPIYIDTILHTLRAYGGTSTEGNAGSCRIACFLDPWQTSTVQDDLQLCDFFFQNQKRSVSCQGQRDFEAKVDKKEEYRAHELEHLFWLFADHNERVEIKLPVGDFKKNPLILSHLTHHKLHISARQT